METLQVFKSRCCVVGVDFELSVFFFFFFFSFPKIFIDQRPGRKLHRCPA